MITVMSPCRLIPILSVLGSLIILLMLARVTTTPDRGAPLSARLR